MAQTLPYCASGESPEFAFGFANLHKELGSTMGDPTECAHANTDNGDTIQHTTTGLSFYRKSTNIPTFTNGFEHWGLTGDGLVHWTGSAIDPPGVVPQNTSPAPSPPTTAGTSTAPAAPLTEADIASRVAPSVVEVVTEDGHGSGVGVAAGILTNAHVVDEARSIEVVDRAGHTAPASVLRIDRNADLALLQASLSVPPLDTEFMGQQRQGDEILVLGYPLDLRTAPGGEATLTRGLISGTGIEQGTSRALIQTDAAVNPGNSGGAMVNMRGKLIGLPTFGRIDAQGINFAVAVDTISAFLQAPQSAVAPAPPTPIFRGDPRTIALSSADFLGGGGSWALMTTDTSHLSDGLFGELFAVQPMGDPSVAVVVDVLPSIRTAADQWPSLAQPSDSTFSDYSVPPIGEATYGSASSAKRELSISTHVKNVLLTAEVSSSTYLTDVGALETSLQQMINRVNAQAR
jgi:S1-C subfamily serine protease